MKKIMVSLVLLISSVSSLTYANRFNYTGSYTLTGNCQGNDGTIYGPSQHQVMDLAYLTGLNNTEVMISTGSSADGYQGCKLFIDLTNCASKSGSFVVDDGQSGHYHTAPLMMEFVCSK